MPRRRAGRERRKLRESHKGSGDVKHQSFCCLFGLSNDLSHPSHTTRWPSSCVGLSPSHLRSSRRHPSHQPPSAHSTKDPSRRRLRPPASATSLPHHEQLSAAPFKTRSVVTTSNPPPSPTLLPLEISPSVSSMAVPSSVVLCLPSSESPSTNPRSTPALTCSQPRLQP